MKGEICDLNIFSEVKEQLTTRQVAESYGLRIRKNGVGYVFKKDAWMEAQAPGFRYYHKLAKLDEMFSEETLRHHVDMPWMAKPYFYSSDIKGLHRAKLSPFQKKFYAKLYRLRIVEQKRFVVCGACGFHR